MESNGRNTISMLYSFLAGGVVGAGAALLLAPRSGKGTRDLVARKMHDTVESARGLGARVAHESDGLRLRAAEGLTKVAAAVAPAGPHKADGRGVQAASA